MIASAQIEIPQEEPIFPYENIINYIPFEEDLNIVSNDNLSFYAPFDNDANDISGSGVIGTINAATNVAGYISNGYSFNGTTSYINYGNILPLSNGGSISVWIKADSNGGYSYGRIINKRGTNGYILYTSYDGIGMHINATSVFSSSYRTIEFGKWYHIVVTFTATEKKLYINGSLKETTYTVASLLPGSTTDNFIIGNSAESDRTFDGIIDEVRVYDNRILSASEVLSLYRNATNKPSTQIITDYKTNTPVTITGNPFSATGKVGSGIYFNEATRLEVTSIDDLKAIGSGDFTFSLWFKKNKNNKVFRLLTTDSTSPPRLHILADNYLYYAGVGYSLKSLAPITDTNWHHTVLIRENAIFYAYLDGVLQGTVTGETTSFAGATALYLGQNTNLDQSFNGYLDEVFIFNTAISYAEVRGLYELTPIKTISGDINYLDLIEQAKSGETIIDGGYIKTNLLETDNALIGAVEIDKNLFSYYNFDNGNIAPTDYCLYAPLNKCNSTFYYNDICAFTKVNNVAYNSAQKISGQHSASFDGTTDALWAISGITLGCNVTVSGWAYTNNYSERMLWSWDTCYTSNLNLYFSGNSISNNTADGSATPFKKADNTNIGLPSTSAWHHYTVVHSGDKNCAMLYIDGSCCAGAAYKNPTMTSSCLIIGAMTCAGEYSWNGYIQEVKLYNRELSASEIKNLSNEFSSTLFPDASGNQNTILLSGSKSTLGVANNGQYLDGFNDYGQINNSNLNSNHSFTIWVNSNDLSIKQTLLHKEGSFSYYLDSGKPAVKIAAGVIVSSNKNIVDNSWHFISYVLNDTIISIYIDGELDTTGTVSALIQNTANIIMGATDTIGSNSFGGYIDEIRIYNRILTENEIKYLYKFKNAHGGTIISGDRIQTGVLRSNLKITCQSSTNFDKPVSEYCLDNGTFILRNATTGIDALTFDGTTLSVEGTICANAGNIGSINIASNKIYTGTGTWCNTNTGFYLDCNGCFSLKNKLSFDGTNLNINGCISATTGSIGGFTILADKLCSSTSGISCCASTNIAIWAGCATAASAPFRVTGAGAITATNASITGTIVVCSGCVSGCLTVGEKTRINCAGYFETYCRPISCLGCFCDTGGTRLENGGLSFYDIDCTTLGNYTTNTIGYITVDNKGIHYGGTSNIFMGNDSGKGITTGLNNTFIGQCSGSNTTTGGSNINLGYRSGYCNSCGSSNILMGFCSGFNIKGSQNTALGALSSYGGSGSTGNNNTFLGSNSGYSIVGGSNNIALGYAAGCSLTSGSGNIFLGYCAGNNETTIGNTLIIGQASCYLIKGNMDATWANRWVCINGSIQTNSCMNFCGCINLMWNNTEKSLDFVFV